MHMWAMQRTLIIYILPADGNSLGAEPNCHSPFGLLPQNAIDCVAEPTNLFLIVLEAGRFNMKVPTGLISSEDTAINCPFD